MRHLLVTNDYPPKVGGIQSYLWELCRRLPGDELVVLTRRHPGWREFDAQQSHPVIRSKRPFLLPEAGLAAEIREIVRDRAVDLVMYDPAFPVGVLGPRMGLPYGVVVHGAEVTVPARLPLSGRSIRKVLREAALVVAGGSYVAAEAERAARRPLPSVVVPPGVDTARFVPLSPAKRARVRADYGLDPDAPVVLTLSRLVPRKGMDRLIEAVASLSQRRPDLVLLVAGAGRDRARLERLARNLGPTVRFLDRVPDPDKPDIYGAADVFAMICRVRWGGLEQEGFGIVFVEAAACGVPQVAGRSGGADEAVDHGVTGFVVGFPDDPEQTEDALERLLADHDNRDAMGKAARNRAETLFSYDLLADRYRSAVLDAGRRVGPRAHELA